jgi:hypothetical protein
MVSIGLIFYGIKLVKKETVRDSLSPICLKGTELVKKETIRDSLGSNMFKRDQIGKKRNHSQLSRLQYV